MPISTATVTQAEIKEAPTQELLALYNKITNKSIKKFADRKAAERQTWNAIQQLAPDENINIEPAKKVIAINNPKTQASGPKKEVVGKRDSYENRIIQILVDKNPKRVDSRAYKKFDILMKHDGKTMREYKDCEGRYSTLDMEKGWPATEIRWSVSLGLIKLLPATK